MARNIGGVLPLPVVEVSVNDRALVPTTAKVAVGQRVRYRVSGDLNHLLCVGGGSQFEKQSPLLRPGQSWILDTSDLPAGSSTPVTNEVLSFIKGAVEVLPAAPPPSAKRASGDDDEEDDGSVGHHPGGAAAAPAASDDDGVDDEVLEEMLSRLRPTTGQTEADDDDEEEGSGSNAAWAAHRQGFKSSRQERVSREEQAPPVQLAAAEAAALPGLRPMRHA